MTTIVEPVELSTPVNLRDLGGIAIDGGILAEGLAIRTDDLSIATPEAANELVAKGLAAVIDLRSLAEASVTGRGPLGELPVQYHHIPVMTDISKSMRIPAGGFTHEGMGRSYISMVESAAPQFVLALNVIALAPGTTAFHCAAGRDRTGVLAALLLLILGASDDDIIGDYGLTGTNMPAIQKRTGGILRPMLKRLGFDLDAMQTGTLGASGMEVSMEMLIAHLRETYGDPLTPLRTAGLSDETIARLRARALGQTTAVA